MPEMEEFYTAEEVAQILRIAEDSVTRLLRTNKMPGYKVAGSWRVNKVEFREYLATRRNIPLEEQK
jgi:excisionase family DNA binding protein